MISKAQEKGKYYVGVEGVTTTKGVFSYPMAGVSVNKMRIQLGVLVGSSYVLNGSVFGLKGDLLFLPNPQTEHPFNFHFIGSLNYFKNSISISSSETKTNTFQITFGYGLEYQLIRNFFITSSIGLGSLVEVRNFNFATNSPKNKWGFAGLLSLGVNYQL